MPSPSGAGVVGAGLGLANAAVGLVALTLFRGQPALLASALLAWGLGLRHALDPDHLAVIDNAVRAGIDPDGRPASHSGAAPGLWFALGHSTIVVVACAAVAAASAGWRAELEPMRRLGETAGPLVSSTLLLVVASMNAVSAVTIWRRRPVVGGRHPAPAFSVVLRLLRPLRGRIARGRAMYPIGLLMGLGFDTASEIALLALAASEVASGLPFGAVLVFPALFAAGMATVDAGNGWVMRRAYRWAAGDAGRRHRCNLAVTAASAGIAFAIAGWQLVTVYSGPATRPPAVASSQR